MSPSRRTAVLAVSVTLAAGAATAVADVEPPVLHAEQRRGTADVTPMPDQAPTGKKVDGRTDDWTGDAPGFSGFSAYSRGELVHTDFLFDAFGADDGDDAERVARNDALEQALPGAYRLEPTYQYDVGGELGVPNGTSASKGSASTATRETPTSAGTWRPRTCASCGSPPTRRTCSCWPARRR
jgi:hypothetical protein